MRALSPFPTIHPAVSDQAVSQTCESLNALLSGDDRLDVFIYRRGDGPAKPKEASDRAAFSVRSFALDPFILGEHLARKIKEHPLKGRCCLAVNPVQISRVEAGTRQLWEAAIEGWWIPSPTVAARGGL